MKIGNRDFRAQSAMEYLMTYGWAILIIAVVLAALFSLNVFNSGAAIGSGTCAGTPGYSCSAFSLAQNGVVSFTVKYGGATTLYNAMFACIPSSASNAPTTLFYNAIYTTGVAYGNAVGTAAGLTTPNPASANLINSGTISVSGVQCYPAAGGYPSPTAFNSVFGPIGTSFTGSIWLAYNPTSGPNPSNPDPVSQYVKIATVAAKSSS